MGQSTQHHRFRFASVVVLVSARGSASPRAGAGELHRQCFANVSQCAGAQIWYRLACASCWISRRLRLGLANRGVRGTCGALPLRPPASLLHKAAFWKVWCSRCAEAPLGAPHRCAPSRVSKTGLMQSGLRWVRSHSRRRFPVACAPYAPPSARPCGCRGTWALVRRCALRFGQWPAASHVVCAPAHPRASPLRGIGPRGLPVRPPRGLPQPARKPGGRAALTRRHSIRAVVYGVAPPHSGVWATRRHLFSKIKVQRFDPSASPVLAQKKSATV